MPVGDKYVMQDNGKCYSYDKDSVKIHLLSIASKLVKNDDCTWLPCIPNGAIVTLLYEHETDYSKRCIIREHHGDKVQVCHESALQFKYKPKIRNLSSATVVNADKIYSMYKEFVYWNMPQLAYCFSGYIKNGQKVDILHISQHTMHVSDNKLAICQPENTNRIIVIGVEGLKIEYNYYDCLF